jgi:ligand-binding sensor domain-containing protein/two-component sensor histidine kinase
MKDRDGFIWIATQKGVCRFDGHDFLPFDSDMQEFPDLSQSDEFDLFQDKEEIIWIATRDQGLFACDRKLKKFNHFSHSELESKSLSDDFVNFVFEDNLGNLWVSSHSHGLDLYDRSKKNFTNYKPSDTYHELTSRLIDDLISYTIDPVDDHVLWFGSLAGLFSFDIKNLVWKYFPLDHSNALNPLVYTGNEKIFRSMVFDKNGTLWAGTWGGGLIRFDPSTNMFEIYKYESLQPINGFRNNIKQLIWKNEQELWIVAPYRGLGVFKLADQSFHFIDHAVTGESLVINPACCIIDSSGFMWVGSRTQGLYTTNLETAKFSKVKLPYSFRTMVSNANSSKILAAASGSNSQLIQIDPATNDFQEFNYKPLFNRNENFIIEILPIKEKTWIVESYNLFYFDGKVILPFTEFDPHKVSTQKQSNPFFISAEHCQNGDIWMGTKFHGLFRVNPDKKSFENFYNQGGAINSPGFGEFVYSLFYDTEGHLWYGSENFGYYDYRKNLFINFSSDKDLRNSDIKVKSVQTIAQSNDGYLWLGTEKNGIAVLKNTNEKLTFIKSFTTKNGLSSNDIFELCADKNGTIWALTGEGLSKINPALDSVENYGYQYGLTALKSLAITPENKILIGSENGYYYFDPNSIAPFSYSAKPYIRSFSIFDQSIDFEQILDSTGTIRLNYDQNFFSIEFGLIDYFQPNYRPLSYKLEGVDHSWYSSSTRKNVSYANLDGGNYIFKLKAANGSELQLPIFIETPFWKTPWFYILIAVVIFSGFLGFYMYRLRQIKKQEEIKSGYNKMINQLEMKALRAQMNPHFLFNSLNSIRYYILKEEFENASDYITKFSKLLRLILRNSRQNMITLKEELDTLRIYIEFEQMRFSKSFTFKEDIHESVNPEEILIQPMTLQPFVENAIWHGLMPKESDRQLSLSLNKTENLLTVIIEDNGVGRQKSSAIRHENDMSESKSYGLQITDERFAILRSIRGKRSDFEITDLRDKHNRSTGTRVTIYYEI